MDKSKQLFAGLLFGYGVCSLLIDISFLLKGIFFLTREYFKSDEEIFWERRLFDRPLEKADDLCEIGYNFQRNKIIYKKISEKKWIAEILIDDDDEFEIGCELEIENYIYKKIGEKVWTIEGMTDHLNFYLY